MNDLYETVDGNKVGTWDAIITIFSGYGEQAKIIRFIHTAEGTDNDKFITLEDCRKMIGETIAPVHVIFDDWTHGDIYTYGNSSEKVWEKTGETIGFA